MSSLRFLAVLPPLLVLLTACGGSDALPDSGSPATDAGTPDAGTRDAGVDDAGTTPPPVQSDVEQKPVIYQLVVRTFGNTNTTNAVDGTLEQNGVGKFEDINAAALSSLRAFGVTHVWLTGVLRQATLTDHSAIGLAADDPDIVKGRAGSFYAVRDYFDVSPDYANDPTARLAEFDAAVDRVHANGMKVLIDLVPNHVSRSYHSVVHPELDFGLGDDQSVFFDPGNDFFYLALSGGAPLELSRPSGWNPVGVSFDGRFAPEDGAPGHTPKATGNNVTSTQLSEFDWYETVKLNYGLDFTTGATDFDPSPSVWVKMDAVLAYWQARGVDGFRCDFAHFVPAEAWRYLIERARQRDADVLFVAEAYDNLEALLAAGFDAVYNDRAYDVAKSMYLGRATKADLAGELTRLSDALRPKYLHYLENHDERRIASPLVPGDNPDASGFGSTRAGRQLAPLFYLYNQGPVLLYNGQETGEVAAGAEGFGGDDGRTSIFDYLSMPSFVPWVNGHAYDGAGLSEEARELRAWYSQLLALTQDASVRGDRFWGLDYFNETRSDYPSGLLSYARFQTGGRRLLVVAANFSPGQSASGRVRIPPELAEAAALADQSLTVRQLFGPSGSVSGEAVSLDRQALIDEGFAVVIEDQAANVYVIE